jgi:hypothetical protein
LQTVLTTTANLKGRELTPDERKAYFEIFHKQCFDEVMIKQDTKKYFPTTEIGLEQKFLL